MRVSLAIHFQVLTGHMLDNPSALEERSRAVSRQLRNIRTSNSMEDATAQVSSVSRLYLVAPCDSGRRKVFTCTANWVASLIPFVQSNYRVTWMKCPRNLLYLR